MKLTPLKLKNIVKIAKDMGVKRLKIDAFEVEFWEQEQAAQFVPVADSSPLVGEAADTPTEDELLMLSTPYFDVLRSQRREAKKAI